LHLGISIATGIRLLLATIVLGIPTFMMGGTLPAAARAVETSEDPARRRLATIYAVNTMGAVAGTLISTFFLLETFGNRRTLLLAAALNLLVAVIARAISRDSRAPEMKSEAVRPPSDDEESLPPLVVLVTSGLVGAAFLLMELVWYRMLGPILGGTTFTFGLILAIALLGIGMGGFAFSLWNRASVGALALTTALEALAMAVPLIAGDRIAHYANLLRTLGEAGFQGHIIAWSIITLAVVFPASFIAGFQFPLLVALLGKGREDVGRDVGQAYAWNTFGSIAGSLGGGFGVIPLLSAPGAWRAVVILLAGLSFALCFLTLRRRTWTHVTASLLIGAAALAGTAATGPTAGWRHSGIGVGRLVRRQTVNEFRGVTNDFRRGLVWEADGRESNVALIAGDDLSFVVNGKSDGSARADAGTQVMGGMIGAILHANPKSAFVIGMGTGSTAGWLGAIPAMERVDVVELEPVVLRIAKDLSSVNRNVLANPKVHTEIADAREALLTGRRRYDIIFSEPSNPYRAGIASLFTSEFYRAAADRLAPGGIFLQWVQTYDVGSETLTTIYATLTSTFPHVDTFWTTSGDVVLVATRDPLTYDAGRMGARLRSEPYRSAIGKAWRGDTAEAFMAQMIANERTAAFLASRAPGMNTDDLTVVEFGFARGLGLSGSVQGLASLARKRGETRPLRVRGTFDWDLVERHRAATQFMPMTAKPSPVEEALRTVASAFASHGTLDTSSDLALIQPPNTESLGHFALTLAHSGDPRAVAYAAKLGETQPIERDAALAQLALRQRRFADAARLLRSSFIAYRSDPWPARDIMQDSLQTARDLIQIEPQTAPMIADALREPFAARQLDQPRQAVWLAAIAAKEFCGAEMIAALRSFEPHPPWNRGHLTNRAVCYRRAGLVELARQAAKDYDTFLDAEPEPLPE
ncbi:MAG: fused MFS/spermidine synthase, partial [Thermoanaerobaculia bacterium]|nr:fused MFS/spermidine synthase [Thermoanaerobaculia bacterium]